MSADIPSTGSLGIDIVIVLITGGAVTTWLSVFFDRLSKKKEEFVRVTEKKLEKLSQSEKVCVQAASFLLQIAYLMIKRKKFLDAQNRTMAEDLTEEEYQKCIFYISKYLHSYQRFFNENAFIQLDNVYSETVIQELFQVLITELGKPKLVAQPGQIVELTGVGLNNIAALRKEFDEKMPFDDFVSEVELDYPPSPKSNLYKIYKDWLQFLNSKRLENIINSALWYHKLLTLELNLAYRIFYGNSHVKEYYTEYTEPYTKEPYFPPNLLDYLEVYYPQYYRRLEKLKLI